MSPNPTSPPSASSDASSSHHPVRSPGILQHAPITPSALRETHTLSGSPEEPRSLHSQASGGPDTAPSHAEASSRTQATNVDIGHGTNGDTGTEQTRGSIAAQRTAAGERTSLLRRPFEIVNDPAHTGPCNHGTFSPRIESPDGSVLGHGESASASYSGDGEDATNSWLSKLLSKVGKNRPRKKKISTTSRLAEAHGITNTTSMYVSHNLSPFHLSKSLSMGHVLMVCGYVGTFLTIYPSLRGSHSIDGFTCKAISRLLSLWRLSIFQWPSLMPQI